eukprot:5430657-Amphidinium_carterae.1
MPALCPPVFVWWFDCHHLNFAPIAHVTPIVSSGKPASCQREHDQTLRLHSSLLRTQSIRIAPS